MITPVSSGVQHAADHQPQASQKSAPAKGQATKTDTVHLGGAASAVQEVYETAAQTIREAAAGDRQAKRLLAKEEAAAKAE